ncbi:MAG: hypothetical protein IK130_07555 [Oscillospiraceae bacterium]|nr:hypothetical protein [Oscillospiraceae bacterium]
MRDRKIAAIQSTMNDQDFSDVYRIYLETEKGAEKKKALFAVSAFFILFLVLLIINKSISFLFMMLGCIVVGASYFFVPINKKFIAENKLLYGGWRETVFYEHHVTVMELFHEDDSESMSEKELREATTSISTSSLAAYETENGFLFADGRISRQFVYIPKRDIDEEQLSALLQFASHRCSGGYRRLHLRSALHDMKTEDPEEMVSGACEKYYGAERLELHDETGYRVNYPEEEEEPAVVDRSAGMHLDVDAELERILSEAEANKHGK